MEERRLPFSRIRLTAETHRASYLMAHTEPRYPAEAAAQGIAGDVVLDAVIGRDGEILKLSAREGHPLLAGAAVAAVSAWKFRPTKINGIPVEVATEVRLTFELPDKVLFD
jgi:TonB family protein